MGNALWFCCAGCGCGGCTASVNYVYEGYLLAAPGPGCGCSSQGGGMPHVETDAGGGVSVGFDRKAVIFEDAYDNSPTDHVARRSTQTVLTLRANGGPHGGTLAGSLVFGGMTVTSVHVAGAKTNDTNQIENGKWRMREGTPQFYILHFQFYIRHRPSPTTTLHRGGVSSR